MDNTMNTVSDQISDLFNDEEEFLLMFKDITSNDLNPLSQKIFDKISRNEIDNDLDLMLLELEKIEPYNFLIPAVRHYFKFSIDTDERCIKFLMEIKTYLESDKDIKIMDDIIKFVNSTNDTNGDTDYESDIIPSAELLNFVDKIPSDHIQKLIECSLYIDSIGISDTNDIVDNIN